MRKVARQGLYLNSSPFSFNTTNISWPRSIIPRPFPSSLGLSILRARFFGGQANDGQPQRCNRRNYDFAQRPRPARARFVPPPVCAIQMIGRSVAVVKGCIRPRYLRPRINRY